LADRAKTALARAAVLVDRAGSTCMEAQQLQRRAAATRRTSQIVRALRESREALYQALRG